MASRRQLCRGKVVSDTSERNKPTEKRIKVATPATRSFSDAYLIGQPSSSIRGSQLPTNCQVFLYFLHLRNEKPNSDNRSLAHDTVNVVLPFWSMAKIRTLTRPNAINRFIIPHEKYRKIVKNKGRDNKPEEEKRTNFLRDLGKLFDIVSKDAVEEIEPTSCSQRKLRKKTSVSIWTNRLLTWHTGQIMTRCLRRRLQRKGKIIGS